MAKDQGGDRTDDPQGDVTDPGLEAEETGRNTPLNLDDLPEFIVPSDDFAMYRDRMERVKLRIDEAGALLREGRDERSYLYAAAQLRLAIEEIAFSSLVGNRHVFEEAERAVRLKTWIEAAKVLRALNPDYWPRGVDEDFSDSPTKWNDVEGALEESGVGRVWGDLSRILHAQNPWNPPVDLRAEESLLRSVISMLGKTLNAHLITLVGGAQLLFCRVWSDPVQIYGFKRKDAGSSSPFE